MSKDPIVVFLASACEDFRESDKMWIHVNRLKQDIGYTPYSVISRENGMVPLSFEEWLQFYGQIPSFNPPRI